MDDRVDRDRCPIPLTAPLPHLYRTGTDVVTRTYSDASRVLMSPVADGAFDPYAVAPQPGSDVYKYSPLFGAFYSIFAALGDRAQSCAWGLFNLAVFWTGLFWLADRFGVSFLPGSRRALLLAALFASFELDGSVRYQQINAALAGVTMMALAALLDGRPRLSAALLALGVNFKILPAFWVPALLRGRVRRWGGPWIAAMLALFVVIPALIWGAFGALRLNLSWAAILRADTGAPGLLDLGTWLLHLGWAPAPVLLARLGVLGICVALTLYWWHPDRLRRYADLGLAAGFCALLLVSPRTESPTFVLLSPVYFFLALRLVRRDFLLPAPLVRAGFVVGLACATLVFHDVWPRFLRPPYFFKTAGTLALFLLLAGEGWQQWRRDRQ